MTIDTSLLAIIVTVLLAIIGLAAAWGALGQRVNSHGKIIEANRLQSEKEMERFRAENREDHRQIFDKLGEINVYIRNGGRRPSG